MQYIRERRTQLGLSAEKAARKACISTSMWVKIERGERTPSLRVAQKVACVLQTTVDELFTTS